MNGGARNVALITADSLRADHCGFLGDDRGLTPNVDGLARDGVAFESAIAPGPRTPTSVPETLTGVPMPHVAADSSAEQITRIADHFDRYETLPERLSAEGYTTVAFSANPWMSARCGLDEKFDSFHDIAIDERSALQRMDAPWLTQSKPGMAANWLEQWWRKRRFFSQWPTFFEDLSETLADVDEPYFLWVFLMDAHNPYVVSRRDRVESSTLGMYYGMARGNRVISHSTGQSTLKTELPPSVATHVGRAYRDSVRSVDRFVGKLLRRVREDRPLIVFHADHGEAFGEHGTYGHQQALYEENVHVPLMMWRPGGETTRVPEPISLRTLPELLVAHCRGERAVTSDEWTDEYVIARSEGGRKIAVRSERSKYIRAADDEELYDLAADPEERRNLASSDVDTGRFQEAIEAYLETVPRSDGPLEASRVSADVEQRLAMLGYDE